jgi:hypothetical protein
MELSNSNIGNVARISLFVCRKSALMHCCGAEAPTLY